MGRSVSSTPYSEAVAKYDVPSREAKDGVGVPAQPVFLVDPTQTPILATSRYGTPVLLTDVVANDSDKTFTVPAGERWNICGITIRLVTTVTVGNRYPGIYINDGVVDVYQQYAGPEAASNNFWVYAVPGVTYNPGTFVNGSAMLGPLPIPCIMQPGYTIRCWDVVAIDPAADDMSVFIWYIRELL